MLQMYANSNFSPTFIPGQDIRVGHKDNDTSYAYPIPNIFWPFYFEYTHIQVLYETKQFDINITYPISILNLNWIKLN